MKAFERLTKSVSCHVDQTLLCYIWSAILLQKWIDPAMNFAVRTLTSLTVLSHESVGNYPNVPKAKVIQVRLWSYWWSLFFHTHTFTPRVPTTSSIVHTPALLYLWKCTLPPSALQAVLNMQPTSHSSTWVEQLWGGNIQYSSLLIPCLHIHTCCESPSIPVTPPPPPPPHVNMDQPWR